MKKLQSFVVEDVGSRQMAAGGFGGINSSGHMVMTAAVPITIGGTPTTKWEAFHFDGKVLQSIHPAGYQQSTAYDINDMGSIVGDLRPTQNFSPTSAFHRDAAGNITVLQTLSQPYHTAATGISASGVVCGYVWVGAIRHSLRWDLFAGGGAQPIDFSDPNADDSYPTAINDKKETSGWVVPAGTSAARAGWYDGGTWHQLAVPMAVSGQAKDINEDSTVVGFRTSPTFPTDAAFVCKASMMPSLIPGNTMQNIRALGATGIADDGTIVGIGRRAQKQIAFIYDEVHGLRDLNDLIPPNLGWTLHSAEGISSSADYICGLGDFVGESRVFRLRRRTIWDDLPYVHKTPRVPLGYVSQVLAGVVDDSGGSGIDPSGGLGPVPPWTDLSVSIRGCAMRWRN